MYCSYMDTKVGKQALKELSKRMDNLNVEFGELGRCLAKLKASDFQGDLYHIILTDANSNRNALRYCQEEISRLIELEQSIR